MAAYVHGYQKNESQRLVDQSQTLADLFYHDQQFETGARVLEAGCGVGAQSTLLASRMNGVDWVSLDISIDSIRLARRRMQDEHSLNLPYLQSDICCMPFEDDAFDHVFVCFVLEHLSNSMAALGELKRVLRPGGTLTVIEGDHGSCYFHPDTPAARHVWNCLINTQAKLGGDSLIGRRLYPLLYSVGFQKLCVTPRFVYADSSRPDWVDGFTRKTIVAMVKGVKQKALELGLTNEQRWREGIAALNETAKEPEGVFCYTFFKAQAIK